MNSSVFHSNSLPTRNVPFNFGAPYPDVLRWRPLCGVRKRWWETFSHQRWVGEATGLRAPNNARRIASSVRSEHIIRRTNTKIDAQKIVKGRASGVIKCALKKTVAGDGFQWNSENEKSGTRLFPWLPGVQWALVEVNVTQRTRLEHKCAISDRGATKIQDIRGSKCGSNVVCMKKPNSLKLG